MEQIFADKMTDGTREVGITLSEQQLQVIGRMEQGYEPDRNYRVGGSGEQAFYRQSGSG